MMEMMNENSLRIAVGPYVFHGCGTTIELLITEMKRDGRRFLTLPRGIRMEVGEVINIIRPLRPHSGVFCLNHRTLKVLGTVKVIGVVEDGRVEVRLLNGKFFGGTRVERIKKDESQPGFFYIAPWILLINSVPIPMFSFPS